MLLLQGDPALPLWLIAACAAALLGLALFLAARTRPRSARWKCACILLPALAGLFALAAAANLQLTRTTLPARIVLLLDLSASTRASPWRDPAWLRALARNRLGSQTHVTIVGFADNPRLLFEDLPLNDPARWPTAWPALDNTRTTDLFAALAWRSAAEAAHEVPLAPRWLLTDGCLPAQQAQTPSPVPFPLAATLIPPAAADLAIKDFTRRPDGELWIQVSATGPARATLTITRDAQPLAAESLTFTEASTRWISITQAAGGGVDNSAHRYEAVIRQSPTPDPWPENDTASLFTLPEGPPRILLVGSPSNLPLQPTASMSPAHFPTTLGPLLDAAWQTIILNDIPLARPGETSPDTLTDQQADTLAQFVRDAGGGLLLLGASHAFGAGHYAHSPLDALSPLASEQPNRPAAQIIFLLDASGSMNDSAGPNLREQKFRLAAHALQSAATLLQPTDDVALITFSNTATLLAAQPLDQLQSKLPAKLAAVQPAGPTNPDSALPTIQHLLATRPAAEPTLLILLTDGQIPALDGTAWGSTLASPHTHLAIIAPPSPGSPLAILARNTHAAWLSTDDPGQWEALLHRAITASFIGHARTDPLPWHTLDTASPPAPRAGETRDWIETWLRPGDQRWILPAKIAAPFTLGAFGQRGLGKVAALSMHDNSPAFASLLHDAIGRITPAPADPRFTLSATQRPGGWTLAADAVENHRFLNHEQLLARIFPANASALSPIPFAQTAPGHYEARFSTGPFTATITRQTPDHPAERIATLHPAQLAVTEWPATVGTLASVPKAVPLASSLRTQQRWRPAVRNWRLPLSRIFWPLSVLCALLSLCFRRAR